MTKKKVLLIEDDGDLREILESFLDGLGLEVLVATNGEEGLQKALDNKVDLVITDIRMPKMDGPTMATKIREAGIDTSIIFMTGHSSYTEKQIAEKCKAILVEKPFNSKVLKELVEQMILL